MYIIQHLSVQHYALRPLSGYVLPSEYRLVFFARCTATGPWVCPSRYLCWCTGAQLVLDQIEKRVY